MSTAAPQTMAQKIIAAHAGRDHVEEGELLTCDVDLVLANDITAPLAINAFRKAGGEKVFDKSKIALVPDHFAPNKDIRSAEQCAVLRAFAKEQEIEHYFEIGRAGIAHALLPEQGLVVPGMLVIGADSHTCTYGGIGSFATGMGSTDIAGAMLTGQTWMRVPPTLRFEFDGELSKYVTGKDMILQIIGHIGFGGATNMAIEYAGSAVRGLPMEDRFTLANMAIEAGGTVGLVEADDTALQWCEERSKLTPQIFKADDGAKYENVVTFDATKMEPLVAYPHSPDNTRPLSEVGDERLDQVVIGSCTNGWITDLRRAAEVLKDRVIAPGLRLIILPATPEIHKQAIREGLIEIFMDAGAVVSTSTCGPCLGGHMGVLGPGERCLSTTSRNFRGRMGHRDAEVFLSNPWIAAASAVAGRIVGPDAL